MRRSFGSACDRRSPRLRFYAYSAQLGDVFGPHYDQATRLRPEDLSRAPRDTACGGNTTQYTALFYLCAPDVRGGETVFYADGDERRELCRVPPEPGAVLLFRQGAGGLLHSSGAVRAGTKWVLRTDLAFDA